MAKKVKTFRTIPLDPNDDFIGGPVRLSDAGKLFAARGVQVSTGVEGKDNSSHGSGSRSQNPDVKNFNLGG